MLKIYEAVDELNQSEAAWADFKRSHYMPWQLDPPTTYAERKAEEDFRRYATKLSNRVQTARENLIAVCQQYAYKHPLK